MVTPVRDADVVIVVDVLTMTEVAPERTVAKPGDVVTEMVYEASAEVVIVTDGWGTKIVDIVGPEDQIASLFVL